MASSSMRGLLLLVVLVGASAATAREGVSLRVNPVRKVVTMLQQMTKKIEAEGETEKALYDEYMCYCKTSGGTLAKAIGDAETKIPQLESDIEAGEAAKEQATDAVANGKADRASAIAAMNEATSIRAKEAKDFASFQSETLTDIGAITQAVAALERGMAGSFLQTSAAAVLRQITVSVKIGSSDRERLTSFLAQDSGYAPQSGEVTGILKQMNDTMVADLKEATATEETAIRVYEELMAAKTKEKLALTQMIEGKLVDIGEIGEALVNMKEDLDDTRQSLEEDKKFLADLEHSCDDKKKDWEYRSQMRADELTAIAETIKVLNDDDALDLFKQTLPSPSLLQLQVGAKEMRSKALEALQGQRHRRDVRLDLITLAIRGKKASFEKVVDMIDEMVALLGKEQATDDEKKAYCEAEIDKAEDTAKEIARSIKTKERHIADMKDSIEEVVEELASLVAGIKALDKSVAEATEQRKEEHEEFVATMAADKAAVEILEIAKNRMQKFYNPALYKPPPKRELDEDERITVNMGGTLAPTQPPGGIAGTGVAVFAQVHARTTVASRDAPPPPPETYAAYAKKGESSGGVIAMIDLLIKDLKGEMTTMTEEEKHAQEDYEKFVADAAEKRAADSKSVGQKESVKAGMEEDLQKLGEKRESKVAELMDTMDYTKDLHLECDWLIKNHGLRKEARAGEVEALKKARAVLSGADYSLLQTSAHRQQRRLRAGF